MDKIAFQDIIRKEMDIDLKLDEPMTHHTTWKIGGAAEMFCQPQNTEECAKILQLASRTNVRVWILGLGSNVLVADNGIKGLVISTKKMNGIRYSDGNIITGSGAALAQVSLFSANLALQGLEFASGIPGSVGGAVIMNAGAFGSSVSNVLSTVTTLDIHGRRKTYDNKMLGFSYRNSLLKGKQEIITEAVFKLQKGNIEDIRANIARYTQVRKDKHPLNLPNAGSVFRNPIQKTAGKLIEEAGCKKMRIGDAQVSEQHANFIVNLGQARATDVLELIRLVQETVYKHSDILLEPEIVLLGFE